MDAAGNRANVDVRVRAESGDEASVARGLLTCDPHHELTTWRIPPLVWQL
jgi:hypothetical protein